jgi:hypothetical protein
VKLKKLNFALKEIWDRFQDHGAKGRTSDRDASTHPGALELSPAEPVAGANFIVLSRLIALFLSEGAISWCPSCR